MYVQEPWLRNHQDGRRVFVLRADEAVVWQKTVRNQRRELVCGLISGVLGWILLVMLIFFPLGSYDTASGSAGTGGISTLITTTHGRRSLWSEGLDAAHEALPDRRGHCLCRDPRSVRSSMRTGSFVLDSGCSGPPWW